MVGQTSAARQISRREFLRTGGYGIASVAAFNAFLVACGGDGTAATTLVTPTGSSTTAASLRDLAIGITSPTVPVLVPNRAGPLDYGPQFGLNTTEDKVVNFATHNTAVQAMLAGDFPVAGGASGTPMNLIEQGENVKFFAPYMQKNVIWAVARRPIETWDDLLNSPDKVSIGSDGPGGGYYFVWDAFLFALNEPRTLEEEFDIVLLEEPPQVNAGFINGDVDAALIHYLDVAAIQEELGDDMVILGKLEEDVPAMAFEAWYASADWLDENLDLATAFCAAILTANRELSKSFDTYKAAVEKHVEGGFPGTNEELQGLWSRIRENEVWPWNEITQDSINAAAEVTQAAGGIENAALMADSLDPRPNQGALDMIGRVDSSDILG